MKAILDTLANPLRVARSGLVTPEWDTTLRWVRRAMWLLVMVVSVWDVTVTFGAHLGFARRFF